MTTSSTPDYPTALRSLCASMDFHYLRSGTTLVEPLTKPDT